MEGRMFKQLTIVSLLVFVGCAAAPPTSPAPKLPATDENGEYSIDWPDLGRGEDRYIDIDLGADTFEHCRQVSPKFPFDSAKTRAQDRARLEALASCLNHESMLDRRVMLVGRTDASGTTSYNEELGKKRANRIKELLVQYGLAANRIEMKSAGEKDTKGDLPEYSQGYDRRVDVIVTGGAHAP
jgi:outer membrane protein OmpA-like peptidoglycan-associated protein